MSKVDAVLFELPVSSGMFENMYGFRRAVKEIYVPCEGVFFNSSYGCGVTHVGRYDDAKKLGTLKIEESDVKILKEHLKFCDDKNSLVKTFFEDDKPESFLDDVIFDGNKIQV